MKLILENTIPITYGLTHVIVSIFENRGPELAIFNMQFFASRHGTPVIVDGQVEYEWREIPAVHIETAQTTLVPYDLYIGLRKAALDPEIKAQMGMLLNSYRSEFKGTLKDIDFTLLEVQVL